MGIERRSRQRDAIIKELKSRCDHPTAMELYKDLRKELPNLSLGTLYRNLSQLEESGMIIKIHDDNNDRFDGNSMPHGHFKCLSCNKVYDVMSGNNNFFNMSDENICQIYGYTLLLYGKCKNCENAV